ncbi:MAG: hypothetical protein JWR24_4116 [Actinoallomurus sp.]|nr:hypothetical protein [Actinoallomurus sp.]
MKNHGPYSDIEDEGTPDPQEGSPVQQQAPLPGDEPDEPPRPSGRPVYEVEGIGDDAEGDAIADEESPGTGGASPPEENAMHVENLGEETS